MESDPFSMPSSPILNYTSLDRTWLILRHLPLPQVPFVTLAQLYMPVTDISIDIRESCAHYFPIPKASRTVFLISKPSTVQESTQLSHPSQTKISGQSSNHFHSPVVHQRSSSRSAVKVQVQSTKVTYCSNKVYSKHFIDKLCQLHKLTKLPLHKHHQCRTASSAPSHLCL